MISVTGSDLVLDKEFKLVYQPDGSVADASDTAITLIDSSERGSTLKKTLRVSKNAGTVAAGELVKEQTGNSEI